MCPSEAETMRMSTETILLPEGQIFKGDFKKYSTRFKSLLSIKLQKMLFSLPDTM